MVWLAMILLSIRPSAHIDAEVSSQDDSMAKITGTINFRISDVLN